MCIPTLDRLTQEIEAMLNGGEQVVRLVDPVSVRDEIPQAAIAEGFTGALVSTSGSTGTSKTVVLSRQALIAAAQATHQRVGAGSWVNPLSPWCVAGLMTRVRAILAGHPQTDISTTLDDLEQPQETAYISIVPTQLYRALSRPDLCEKLAGFEAVLVGGAALDPRIHGQALERGIHVVTTYGMSETCGGVVYDGLPLDGVEIDFAGEESTVVLRTPTVFDGYLGEPELTRTVLCDGAFLTSDRGRLVDGRLEIIGRIDDVIQSGGVNVDLAEIQRRLDEFFPQEVACFAVPDPIWGMTVIVASLGPSLAAIQDRLKEHLDSAARPRGILELENLPRTSSGKIDPTALVDRWRQGG